MLTSKVLHNVILHNSSFEIEDGGHVFRTLSNISIFLVNLHLKTLETELKALNTSNWSEI